MPVSDISLDDITSITSSRDDEGEEYRLAEEEWQESLEQLQQLASMVLLPFIGKWLGRKWSYWGTRLLLILQRMNYILTSYLAYARYLQFGLGKDFVFGPNA